MREDFRTVQAVSDLIHHVKPLLAPHLAAVAEASGLTLAQTGESFRLLRDDGYRFQRDETLPLLDGLETIAITQAEGFDLAVVVLLADALQRRQVSTLLSEAWAEAVVRLRNWPATLRAAMAHGLRRAIEFDLLTVDPPPTDPKFVTRQVEGISDALLRMARAMRPDELLAVARADHGRDAEQHLAALREVISKREGIYWTNEVRFPCKVVRLTANVATAPGFEGCTAILLLNALKDGDRYNQINFLWERLGAAYSALRPSARDPIFAAVRYIYESDPAFSEDLFLPDKPKFQLGFDSTIPVVDDLL